MSLPRFDEYQELSAEQCRELLQSDARYALIVENFREYAFITLDKDGYIQSWDGGAEKLLQYRKDEAVGKHGSIFFTAHDVARGHYKWEISHALEFGYAEDERWHVRKDGTTFWGSGIMAPIFVRGKHVGFGKIFRDRTKQTAHEQRKDDFVGIAGHELRNPLSVLKSSIELALLMPEVAENPQLVAIHKGMNDQVDRLTHLISDLLDLSKIASGQLSPNKQRINLKTTIREMAETYQSTTASHTLVLTHGDDVEVQADKDQIIQVMCNLISNAVKYSPNADRVEISLYDKPEHALVCVRDFGIGISEAEKDKIFERFYRVGNKSSAASGLGIGLYVSLEIVKAHGGTMEVESKEGEGSMFSFTLPK